MIPFFAPRKIAFDRGVDEAEPLSRADRSFGLEGRCTRVAALSGADLQAGDAAGREGQSTSKERVMHHHTWLIPLSASLRPALSRTIVPRPP
jgi:hypothetical protein